MHKLFGPIGMVLFLIHNDTAGVLNSETIRLIKQADKTFEIVFSLQKKEIFRCIWQPAG